MLPFISFILITIGTVYSDDSLCPPGSYYVPHYDNCLSVVQNGARFGFHQADVDCTARGGHLSYVRNAWENSLIQEVAHYHAKFEHSAYIGLIRKSGRWTWLDGTSVTYANFATGQPNEKDDCAVLSVSDGKWYSESCTQKNASYFCTLPLQGTTSSGGPTGIPTTTTSATSCSFGWTPFENNCYFFNDTWPNSYTWEQARGFCQNDGGDLASIHSVQENQFLSDLASTEACFVSWIGLRWDRGYSWSDGSAVDFNKADKHDAQSPIAYFLNPSCRHRDTVGVWDDRRMTIPEPNFICKKPATFHETALTKSVEYEKKPGQVERSRKTRGQRK